MKQRMLLYGLTLLLGVFALSSCVNEDSACLPEGNDAKVIFTLVLPENAQTRADGDEDENTSWGDTYDSIDGTVYDNYIELDGIQVLVFDYTNNTNGTYQGTIDDFIYTKTADNVYTYYGTAPSDLGATGTYKFIVLANYSPITSLTVGTSTISAIDNIAYSLASMDYIPMWGVHKATLDLKAGRQFDIGDIYLLRAISKVSVKLSDEMKTAGYKLQSVTVDKYNKTGYVLPSNASTVEETTALDQELCIKAYTDLAESLSGTKNDNEFLVYLPEYANATSKDATMSVVVVDPDGEELEFPAGIAFKKYSTNGVGQADSEYDIVRNHHYIFTITGAEVGHQLTLIVQTIPWEDEKMTIDYTETISWKDGGAPSWYPALTPENSGTETIDGVQYTVLFVNAGETPSCSFTLDAPKGWLWYAELEPLTEGANNFITFTDGSTTTSGSVGQAATLNLKIATGSTSVTHESRLRMYVRTASGDKSLEVKSLKYIISRSI